MDLIYVDCELVLDALYLEAGIRGVHYRSERANREVLSHALELATNPIVVLLFFPPILQFVDCFA